MRKKPGLFFAKLQLFSAVIAVSLLAASEEVRAQLARDPGVRPGGAAAGAPIAGLSAGDMELFQVGLADFAEEEGVGDGLGPRFNLDSCGGCHLQPAVGGSSPAINPQVLKATEFGARNIVPSFITPNGPIREARFKFRPDGSRDGSVHGLFVISGRVDDTGNAAACTIVQDNFASALAANNVIFRIPTPVFGAGLIEQIPDSAILANMAANAAAKSALGIGGRPNRNTNDGTIARFGWKAQNKSLLLFSGEAYNIEMGITNELFQTERDETATCQFAPTPNDVTIVADTGAETVSAIEKFAFFMRFLAGPATSADTPGGAASIARGRTAFTNIGCTHCHTPTLRTGPSSVATLGGRNVNLFSDLLLHRMGPNLADDILQGDARGDEFRTAPLWGIGQRIFFLHDGRTNNLIDAIRAHRSVGNAAFGASEANAVIDAFDRLPELTPVPPAAPTPSKQDLLNFLRSI